MNQVEKIEFEPRNSRGWPKTQQQLDWALYHIRDGMPVYAAAIKAGYSKKSAAKQGYQLVDQMRPFLAFLQERKNEQAERRYNATTTRVLREITALAFSNRADYVRRVTVGGLPQWVGRPIDELSEEAQLCVESFTIEYVETDDEGTVSDFKYVLHDKTQNLFALGKHLGMFNEKIMLELSHREAQARRVKFSDLPTDTIVEMMETLQQYKEMAKDAAAIPGESRRVEDQSDG